MTDLTGTEIEHIATFGAGQGRPSRKVKQAITQLLRQLDAAEVKTEAHRQALMATENGLTIADYEEVLADKRRLVREMDVALHGEQGAAKQASLCDLIGPALALRAERDAANARADAAAGQMRERCAVMIETHALVYSNAPPKLVQSSRAVEDTHHKTIAAAVRTLPLHEELQP